MDGLAFNMLSIIENKRVELADLCRRFSVKKLELFGSALEGRFDLASSDLDFLVEFEQSTPTEHASRYFGFLSGLRDLFARKVDLVEFKAIRNPYFKEKVETFKVRLYGT